MKIFSKLFLTVFVMLSLTVVAQEQSDSEEIQPGSESMIKKTTEEKDGVTTETVHAGKVKSRKGGPKVGQIEDSETGKFKKRFESLNLSAFGFGPYTGQNVGNNKVMYGLSFGKIWDLKEAWEIRADLFGAFNSVGSFINFGLGPDYIFNDGDISPFLGGQLGYGFAKADDTIKGSFYAQANLGLKMFRLSTTQLEVLGSYSMLLVEGNFNILGVQLRLLY